MTAELGLDRIGSPGPVTLAALASLDPAALDETALTEAIAGLAAVVAWTQAVEAGFVAELVARRGGLTPDPETAADELEPEWEREILGTRLGIGAGSARLLCETSVALADRLPATAAALEAGDLTWQHVVNLGRETTGLDAAAAGRVERAVLADPRVVTPVQVRNRARKLAAGLMPAPPEPCVVIGQLHAENTGDGGVGINVTLSAEDGRTVATCLDALATKTGPDDDRVIATRRADALVELCRWRLDLGDLPPTPSGARPHLTLTVDADQLRRDARGTLSLRGPVLGASEIGAEAARRLVCDPGVSVAQLRDGVVLDLGREHRYAPPAMRRRLDVRDDGCRFPGCTRHAARCHAHHVVHWADGGPTSEDNVLLLCPRHHHAVHDGGWSLEFDGRHARWTDPHGRPYRTPPPLSGPADPDDLLPFFARSWSARRRPEPPPTPPGPTPTTSAAEAARSETPPF